MDKSLLFVCFVIYVDLIYIGKKSTSTEVTISLSNYEWKCITVYDENLATGCSRLLNKCSHKMPYAIYKSLDIKLPIHKSISDLHYIEGKRSNISKRKQMWWANVFGIHIYFILKT